MPSEFFLTLFDELNEFPFVDFKVTFSVHSQDYFEADTSPDCAYSCSCLGIVSVVLFRGAFVCNLIKCICVLSVFLRAVRMKQSEGLNHAGIEFQGRFPLIFHEQ